MRVGPFVLVATLGLFGATSAYAAQPQCSDGVDNDGDGQIDYAGGNFGEAPPDTDCRSATWNSESSGSDMGYHPFDGSAGAIDAGHLDGGHGDGGGIPPGETCDGSSCSPFVQPDGGGTITGGGGSSGGDGTLDPPRHGCDIGGSSSATFPLLLLLGAGCGIALLSRRTRA